MRRLVLALTIVALGFSMRLADPAAATEGNDQRVANLIAKNLQSSEALKGFKIKVQFRDGIARLEGHVRNQGQLDEALAIANRTPQVEQVINQLEVKEPAAPAPVLTAPVLRAATVAAKPQRLPQPAPEAQPQPLATAQEQKPISRGTNVRPARAVQETPRVETSRLVSRGPTLPPPPMSETLENKSAARPDTRKPAPAPMQQASNQPATQRSALTGSRTPTPSHALAMEHGWGRGSNASTESANVPRRPRAQPMPVGYTQGQLAQAQSAYPAGYAMGQMAPAYYQQPVPMAPAPVPAYVPGVGGGTAPALYDQPYMPNYAWPSYAAYPNYAALTYPKQYSPTAWPYIGPFYPYPQVPLGWRKVTLEWDDGWWFLDFSDDRRHGGGR